MRRPTFAVAVLLFALSGLSAQAAEITVLGGMGVVSAIRDLAPAFEQKTGHKVIVSQEQIPTMNGVARSACGRRRDRALRRREWISKGKLVAGTATSCSGRHVGVAVKAGAAKPDISTVARLSGRDAQ